MTYKNITNLPYERSSILYSLCHWDNIFDENELIELEKYCSQFPLQSGRVIADKNESGYDTDIRKSKISFIDYSNENKWIFDKLNFAIELVNNNYYNFDINGYDFLQYAEYDSSDLGKYEFHTDIFWGENTNKNFSVGMRKLSMVLFLSDPKSYAGGNFQFKTADTKFSEIEQIRGRLAVFPSFLFHRVAPVTSGKRKSITGWITGPKFR